MDKQSILKFFNDNTTNEAKQDKETRVIVNNYGDHATTNIGCKVANNINLTACDKAEVYELIRTLENKNKK